MRRIIAMALGLYLAGASVLVRADEVKAPDVLISEIVKEVLDAVGKDKALHDGDSQKVKDLVEARVLPHFDFTRMTQKTVGAKSWRAATPEQRTALISEYRNFLVRFYTKAFAAYQDQKVEVKPLKMSPADDEVTVKTQIVKAGVQPVLVDYDMHKTPSGWKTYDVSVQEISLVGTYKQQFAEKIEQSGIDGLIKWLSEKNQSANTRKTSK